MWPHACWTSTFEFCIPEHQCNKHASFFMVAVAWHPHLQSCSERDLWLSRPLVQKECRGITVFGTQEASPVGSSYPPEVDGNFENPLFQEDCVYPPTSCSTAADFIKEGRGGSLPLAPASQPALCSHWIVQPLHVSIPLAGRQAGDHLDREASLSQALLICG